MLIETNVKLVMRKEVVKYKNNDKYLDHNILEVGGGVNSFDSTYSQK